MTEDEWGQALGPETDTVEHKQSDRDVDELLNAACAFANDLGNLGRPGFIVLGVNKRGQTTGVDTSDSAVQQVVNRLTSTKIVPLPSFDVAQTERDGLGILAIRVQPYPVPPVVKVDGRAWVRVGTETRRATDADLARLQERRPERTQPFDLRHVASAALDDLDTTLLRQLYAAERGVDPDEDTFPQFEKWLVQRDLLRQSGPRLSPTAAGVLVYGVDPQRWVPGALVEFVRFGGADFDADVTLRKTISGRLTDQLEGLWTQLQANLAEVPAGTSGIRTPYLPEYPIESLKELARNLVQHRLYEGTHAPGRVSWFEDRIVFTNPGGRFGSASEGEFGEHADYRNPTITRLLVETGHVERLGRGIRRVQLQLQKLGHPPLEVETDGFTTVTIRKRK